MTLPRNNNVRKLKGINVWLVAVIALLIASLINWFMLTNMAAPKSVYSSEAAKINNALEHLNDASASLTNFTSYEDTKIDNLSDDTQSQFDDVNNSIKDANTNIGQAQSDLTAIKSDATALKNEVDGSSGLSSQLTSVKSDTDTLKNEVDGSNGLSSQLTTLSQTAATQSALNTLSTKVSSLTPSLQIIPTWSSGYITLTINSDVAQTVAFQIVFRPVATFSLPAGNTSMDTALATFYATPPIVLTAGSVVRGDYTFYHSTSTGVYNLGLISFITMGTSLSAGANTKTITYTTSSSYSYSSGYEILITPVYLTGTSTGSW
jgi:predicted DNA binding CopG/RHH family protein